MDVAKVTVPDCNVEQLQELLTLGTLFFGSDQVVGPQPGILQFFEPVC